MPRLVVKTSAGGHDCAPVKESGSAIAIAGRVARLTRTICCFALFDRLAALRSTAIGIFIAT